MRISGLLWLVCSHRVRNSGSVDEVEKMSRLLWARSDGNSRIWQDQREHQRKREGSRRLSNLAEIKWSRGTEKKSAEGKKGGSCEIERQREKRIGMGRKNETHMADLWSKAQREASTLTLSK